MKNQDVGNPQKRLSRALSPVEKEHQNKKINMLNIEASQQIEDLNIGNLKSLLGSLIEKVDQLRDAVDSKCTKLELTITTRKHEIRGQKSRTHWQPE